MLDIRQLKSLVAIADFGSFAAAAEAGRLTQSAVSLQVKGLEAELGVELFDRRRRPPVMNETGRAVVEQARKVLQLCDEIANAGRHPPLEGVLGIGAVPSCLNSILPQALLIMRERHPRLRIRVTSGLSAELVAATRSGELDGALVTEPDKLPIGTISHPVAREALVVIAPPDTAGSSDAELLESGPFIQFSRRAWAGRQIEQQLSERKIRVDRVMELDALDAITGMVRQGLGNAVVPLPRNGMKTLAGLKWLPFGDPPLYRSLTMIESVDNPQAALFGVLANVLKGVSQAQNNIS